MTQLSYQDFLASKAQLSPSFGFDVPAEEVNEHLKPFNRDIVRWAMHGGRRAIFAAFGLHKTAMQLEIMRLLAPRVTGPRLIVLPLGVRQEFKRDADLWFKDDYALKLKFIRTIAEVDDERTIYLTNYESVREGKLDVAPFKGVSLDEASVLRGFGGTKTFRQFMKLFEGTSTYRFVATATPSPNEYIELLAYAGFLDVMDIGQAKTRFFKRNSEKADQLTIHPHKEKEFFLWCSTWAMFLQKPSDLCRCECRREKNWQDNDSAILSQKTLIQHSEETAHGYASATAVARSSSLQIASCEALSSVADVCDQNTAEKEPAPSVSGKACSTDVPEETIRTGANTAAGELPSASAGANSPTSLRTWANHQQEQPSSDETIRAATSHQTASGPLAKRKPGTLDDQSSSLTTAEHNHLPHGQKNTAPTIGNFTAATKLDGQPSVSSQTCCDKCRCDDGYVLPDLDIRWHEVPSDHTSTGHEVSGQGRLHRNAAIGVQDAAREKRDSLHKRVEKLLEIRAEEPDAHRIIWHDLEREREAIESATPAVSVYGKQDLDDREKAIIDFSDGKIQEMAGKPSMLGSGCNFQRHCAWAIFLGIGFKFNDFYQAIHRLQRFGQTKKVRLDLIYTEAERGVRTELLRKWTQHVELVAKMTEIIREYGLAANAIQKELGRSIGVEREEVSTENFTVVNNDCVIETARMEADSVHLILTSIPFSTQYEYTPSYNDFGHTDSNNHFFEQMDYLTPELLRVLQPGRVCAIHVKDRIVPGGLTGLGFQTVYPFSDETIAHFRKHGFAFLGRKTIVTDVVRENNQTYRLGWTEQCKDGSRMGAGMPEYLLLFRKPPTDRSNGYADVPVVKDKNAYSRSRWQIDAHGFMRSGGNRLISAEDLLGVPHERIFKMFRKHSLTEVYDHEHHIRLSESLETCAHCSHIHTDKKCSACDCTKNGGRLPVTFMLLQPQSWHEDVWTDVARMRTLNGAQSAAGREMHLCPLQLDIVQRVINQFSMKGETVYDPFAGIGTVPSQAVEMERIGRGAELNPRYFHDMALYCRLAEKKKALPTLFDLVAQEECEVSA